MASSSRAAEIFESSNYTLDFACDETDPLQRALNEVCDYGDDVATKVLHRSRLNLFWLLMKRLIARGEIASFGSAIDIGCNVGVYSWILSTLGFRYVEGIDVVPEMIHKAHQTFGSNRPEHEVRFELRSAEALDTARKFDFVLCTEVIEHTEHPDRVITNIKELIAPGGVAVISLPNRISLPYLMAWLAYVVRSKPRDPVFERHLEYPFDRSIRLFHGEGIELIGTDGTNLIWDPRLIQRLHGTAVFPIINRINFRLARRGPLKYASQFFYLVLRKSVPLGT